MQVFKDVKLHHQKLHTQHSVTSYKNLIFSNTTVTTSNIKNIKCLIFSVVSANQK
jgi:hypothetical protein